MGKEGVFREKVTEGRQYPDRCLFSVRKRGPERDSWKNVFDEKITESIQ